jgi:hypothetical protein
LSTMGGYGTPKARLIKQYKLNEILGLLVDERTRCSSFDGSSQDVNS